LRFILILRIIYRAFQLLEPLEEREYAETVNKRRVRRHKARTTSKDSKIEETEPIRDLFKEYYNRLELEEQNHLEINETPKYDPNVRFWLPRNLWAQIFGYLNLLEVIRCRLVQKNLLILHKFTLTALCASNRYQRNGENFLRI
jgi:hypothetical protein